MADSLVTIWSNERCEHLHGDVCASPNPPIGVPIEITRIEKNDVVQHIWYVTVPVVPSEKNAMPKVAWNGLTTVKEQPGGADNIKYVNLLSAETYSGTIWSNERCEHLHGDVRASPNPPIGVPVVPSEKNAMQTLNGTTCEVPVSGHRERVPVRECKHQVEHATIGLRQIGWIDQKGVVYPLENMPSGKDFHGGSFTPLLINPGCD